MMTDHYLAIQLDGAEETIIGIETVEPTLWPPLCGSPKKQRKKAELLDIHHRRPLGDHHPLWR